MSGLFKWEVCNEGLEEVSSFKPENKKSILILLEILYQIYQCIFETHTSLIFIPTIIVNNWQPPIDTGVKRTVRDRKSMFHCLEYLEVPFLGHLDDFEALRLAAKRSKLSI